MLEEQNEVEKDLKITRRILFGFFVLQVIATFFLLLTGPSLIDLIVFVITALGILFALHLVRIRNKVDGRVMGVLIFLAVLQVISHSLGGASVFDIFFIFFFLV